MITLYTKQKEIEKSLMPITDAWQYEAKVILCHVLDVEPIELVLAKQRLLSQDEQRRIDDFVTGRIKRVPLQYLVQKQGFYGFDYFVNESVLIPRPETETLVERIINTIKIPNPKILDIGVGSGAIAITLAMHFPFSSVVGSDISENAIEVAKKNAIFHNVSERVQFVLSDLFENIEGKFDLIVSNPPYIPIGDLETLEPEVTEYEPHIALFAGEDGLDIYRRLIPKAKEHLNPNGYLYFEAGHNQYEAIEALLKENDFKSVDHFSDLNGIPRFIYGQR